MAREMKDSAVPWIGKIPNDWETIRLKYCTTILSGYPFDSSRFSNTKGTPLIRIRDITSGMIETFYDGEYDSTFIVKNGDLLVGMDGDFNVRLWNAGHALLNQRCCKISSRSEYNLKFIYYCLPILLYRINVLTYSTTVKHLSVNDIWNSFIPRIPLAKQNAIVKSLDTECARIDAVIEQTRASIEEYKKLKQAVITQAVTKGIRPNRPMKDSGVEWIGYIPSNWNIYRIANLYNERTESGLEHLPILTLSINTGISDHEVNDDEQIRKFVRSEDRTQYKRVYPGDLAYNMMRAWQGAFGAVRVNGMISPAYVVAKPKFSDMIDNRYMEALLRTSCAIEEMHRFSRGITDFRLRLYWPEFKNIKVCLPPYAEQKEIADYIDSQSSKIDKIISKKTEFISELEDYKKSIIFEYVTGKKEVIGFL